MTTTEENFWITGVLAMIVTQFIVIFIGDIYLIVPVLFLVGTWILHGCVCYDIMLQRDGLPVRFG